MKMPLENVTVLDLSHALAGPHCSTLLADFGAQVIKLETPGAGDIARAWGVPLPGGENTYFVGLHRNKQGVSIDLKTDEGKALFFRLAEKADVLLENFRPGALEKLGLGYEAVKARNPGIVYCSVSGFGQDGPYRDRAALDLIVQAESGLISVTGEAGSHGSRCGVSIADLTAGMYAAFGILLALRVKERTGEGQRVDVSMLEGQMSLLNVMISAYLADHEIPVPMGTAYKALLPYQTFRTQTRDLALAVGSHKLWKVFCPVDRAAGPHRRPPLRDQCPARPASPGTGRHHPAGPAHPDLRAVGGGLPRAGHSGRRDQQRRATARAPAGEGPRRDGRHDPPSSRPGEDGRRAGEAVEDARCGAHAVAAVGRAFGADAANDARDFGRGDPAADGRGCGARAAGHGLNARRIGPRWPDRAASGTPGPGSSRTGPEQTPSGRLSVSRSATD